MVQMRHFGDDRDYFKHDLISWILDNRKPTFRNLVYVPMLTLHKQDTEEANRPPDITRKRSSELLTFMAGCATKSLQHWQTWYTPRVTSYNTVEPVDETFFKHEARLDYWKLFNKIIPGTNALVFVDADTGLETKSIAYMEGKGIDKYIFNNELLGLYRLLHPSSALMLYQHLPRDTAIHVKQVEKKLNQVDRVCKPKRTTAYREDDVSFLFITKATDASVIIRNRLQAYCEKSKAANKTLV